MLVHKYSTCSAGPVSYVGTAIAILVCGREKMVVLICMHITCEASQAAATGCTCSFALVAAYIQRAQARPNRAEWGRS